MTFLWIILLVLYMVLTHWIAKYIGAKREIGYGKSVFWSILFSPIIGFFISIWSRPVKQFQ